MEKPDRDVMLRALELEWQDHFQTRRQTWKTLEIAALAVFAAVIADSVIADPRLLVVMAIAVGYLLVAGIVTTMHHRRAQVRKFTHIDRLEEALGLHGQGLLDDVHPPKAPRWTDVVDVRNVSTPMLIMRMHAAMLIFFVAYVAVRFGR